MTESVDLGRAYREHREGMCAFVLSLSPAQLATKLPACSDWTAREAIAHVAGIPADVAAGRLDGVGSDAWTQAHIDARLSNTLEEIVAEWSTTGAQIEAMADAAPIAMVQSLVSDLVTHDFDVRAAFGDTAMRDTSGAAVAYTAYANRLGARLAELGISVKLIADGEEQVVGAGPLIATVSAARWEFSRALTGRRSARQILALEWDGDASKVIDTFSTYPMRSTDLVE